MSIQSVRSMIDLNGRKLSFVAAFVITFGLLLILALIHGSDDMAPLDVGGNGGIRLQTLKSVEPSEASANVVTPSFKKFRPKIEPLAVDAIVVEYPELEIDIEASELVEWHFSYEDLGSGKQMHNSYGVVGLGGVDEGISSVLIPEKEFPVSLIDEGVVECRVVLTLQIDESGRSKVLFVHSASHEEVVPIVVASLNAAIYSVPLSKGRPTKLTVERTIIFRASPEKILERQAINNK